MIKIFLKLYERYIRYSLTKIFDWYALKLKGKDYTLPDIHSILDVQKALNQIKWQWTWWWLGAIEPVNLIWKNKKAYCSGYAMLAYTLLMRVPSKWCNGVIVTIYGAPLKTSHTIFIFDIGHKRYVVSNSSILTYSYLPTLLTIVANVMQLVGMESLYFGTVVNPRNFHIMEKIETWGGILINLVG